MKDVVKAIRSVSRVESVRELDGGHSQNRIYEIRVSAHKTAPTWLISISLPANFPFINPVLTLISDSPSHLAHVNHAGVICVNEGDDTSVDLDARGDVAAWWLEEAIKILDEGAKNAANDQHDALLDEFEGYWFSVCGESNKVDLFEIPEPSPAIMHGFVAQGQGEPLLAISRKKIPKNTNYIGHKRYRGIGGEQVVYIPLVSPSLPPLRKSKVTKEYFKNLISALPINIRTNCEQTLRVLKSSNRKYHILFSQPRPSGEFSYFGVTFEGNRKGRNPLLYQSTILKAKPWYVSHHYPAYQMPRAGTNENVTNRSVVIIGCGSVGGQLAHLLVQAGIRCLTLVDSDYYSSDNLYRHILPAEYIGCHKVSAMKAFLQRKFPDLDIYAEVKKYENWYKNDAVQNVDLICLATGNPSLERAIVREHFQDCKSPAILSTWLEPLGVGGHAVLTRPGVRGCLECLYHDHLGHPNPRQCNTFMKEGQTFHKALRGCVGTFTPYSAIDSTQTATIAGRLAIDYLEGNAVDFYSYWRGEDSRAKKAGKQTSNWYEQVQNWNHKEVQRMLLEYNCPVCRSGKL